MEASVKTRELSNINKMTKWKIAFFKIILGQSEDKICLIRDNYNEFWKEKSQYLSKIEFSSF